MVSGTLFVALFGIRFLPSGSAPVNAEGLGNRGGLAQSYNFV